MKVKYDKEKYTVKGSEKDAIELDRFQKQIDEYYMNMSSFETNSIKWLDKNGDRENMQKFNAEFQKRMLVLCAAPLARGINSRNIAISCGTFIGMALGSGGFSSLIKQKIADNKVKSKGGEMNFQNNAGNFEKAAVEWLRKSCNGGRVPFTEESVACMNIALAREAHDKMCECNGDVKEVMKEYEKRQRILKTLCKVDGIDEEKLSKATFMMCGRLADKDPSIKALFKETSLADDIMKTNEKVTYDKNFDEQVVTTYDGELLGRNGKPITKLNLKEPLNATKTSILFCATLSEKLSKMSPEDFNKNSKYFSKLMEQVDSCNFDNIDDKKIKIIAKVASEDGVPNKIFKDFNAEDIVKESKMFPPYNLNHKFGISESMQLGFARALDTYSKQSPEHAKAIENFKIQNRVGKYSEPIYDDLYENQKEDEGIEL